MQTGIRVSRNIEIPMRDETILRADMLAPDDNHAHPAILIRTPYSKKRTLMRGELFNAIEFAFAGYVVIVQDVRGRFASDGVWKRQEMLTVEADDAYDSIEWIAAQAYCNGNIGMAGASYLAGLQWIAAMSQPPHLKAIAPWMGGLESVNRGMQPAYEAGVISLASALSALPMTSFDIANRLEHAGHDVSEMRQVLNEAVANPENFYNFLPLKDIPLAQFDRIREMWYDRLHPAPPLDAITAYGCVTVPCFHLVGCYDLLEYTCINSFIGMQKYGASEIARDGQYLTIGPWSHAQFTATLGDLNFGNAASSLGAQVHEQLLAFFNKYLRGVEAEIPKLHYFLMGANQWKTASNFPLTNTAWTRFYLHSTGNANTVHGNGYLDTEMPDNEAQDYFIYDPHRPVPSLGGRINGVGVVAGPIEQSVIEKRHDVLVYTTAALSDDIEVTGSINLHLFASSTVMDTDFCVKLIDVYPDGRAYNVAEGIKRTRRIALNQERDARNILEYIIPMGNTCQLFKKGHRIRIDISSSNFPMFDRNMNTGNEIGSDEAGIVAIQTIYHQRQYPSYIDLPIIPHSS